MKNKDTQMKEQKRQLDTANAHLIKANNKMENLKRELETIQKEQKFKKLNVREAIGK